MAETDQEVAPLYNANPNQKVYDTAHVVDHEVNVLAIYFAEKVKKYKWIPKQDTYTVKNGGKISDVIDKYKKPTRRNIITDPNPTTPLKKGDIINVSWEEQEDDGFEFKKINKADLGKKVFVVANCIGAKGKLEIEIYENLQTEKEAIYTSPIKFLIADAEKTKIEFTLTTDKTQYEQEITLRPKDDKALEVLEEKFGKRTKKEAYVFLKANVTGTDDTIKYPSDKNEFLNKDGERFVVKNCGCIKYFIKSEELNGPNVVLTKSGNSVSGHAGVQAIKAIILHRTAGSTTAGAIAHSKGTHFYVDGAKGTDGEIFQPVKLDKYTNHIMNATARTSHLDIQTENSIGIETVGMAYVYYGEGEDKKLITIYELEKVQKNSKYVPKSAPESTIISKAYTGSDGSTFYWDALTEAQIKSVKCLVKTLLDNYSLTVNDIYTHEEIQSKTAGEGAVVKEAIIGLLNECL
jgi:N-acetyl-anhydromuramyl-L-alanine amidase AmpD